MSKFRPVKGVEHRSTCFEPYCKSRYQTRPGLPLKKKRKDKMNTPIMQYSVGNHVVQLISVSGERNWKVLFDFKPTKMTWDEARMKAYRMAKGTEESRCIHGMIEGTCAHCKGQVTGNESPRSPRTNDYIKIGSWMRYQAFCSCNPIMNEIEWN